MNSSQYLSTYLLYYEFYFFELTLSAFLTYLAQCFISTPPEIVIKLSGCIGMKHWAKMG